MNCKNDDASQSWVNTITIRSNEIDLPIHTTDSFNDCLWLIFFFIIPLVSFSLADFLFFWQSLCTAFICTIIHSFIHSFAFRWFIGHLYFDRNRVVCARKAKNKKNQRFDTEISESEAQSNVCNPVKWRIKNNRNDIIRWPIKVEWINVKNYNWCVMGELINVHMRLRTQLCVCNVWLFLGWRAVTFSYYTTIIIMWPFFFLPRKEVFFLLPVCMVSCLLTSYFQRNDKFAVTIFMIIISYWTRV